MDAPGQTYAFLSAIDTAGPTFQLFQQQTVSAAAGTNLQLFVTNIPKDRVLVLTNAVVHGTPGAAQHVRDLSIAGWTQMGASFLIARKNTLLVDDQPEFLNWAGRAYLMGAGVGNNTAEIQIRFDATVAANSAVGTFSGIVIPRGNIATF